MCSARESTKIKDIMSINPQYLTPNSNIKDAAKKMKAINIGFLPICENGKVIGALTDRDIVIGIANGRGLDTKVKEIMTPNILYCFEDDSIENASYVMRQEHVRRLAVLNIGMQLVGVLSIDDIAAKSGINSITGEILGEVNAGLKKDKS